MLRLVFVSAFVGSLALAGDPPGVVAPAVRFDISGATPVVADLNVDGLPDVLSAGQDINQGGVSRLSASLGIGGGLFGPPSSLSFSAYGAEPPAIGDFDEDGFPDAALAIEPWVKLSILHGVGDGSFVPQSDVQLPAQVSFAVALDSNLDGHLDLAVFDSTLHELRLLAGAGDGTFSTAATRSFATQEFGTRVADLDLDGDADLITWTSNVVTTTIHVTQGGGPVLLTPGPDIAVNGNVADVAVGQIVGSAHPDLALALAAASSASVIVRNIGGTSFAPQAGLPDDEGWDGVLIADVGGDGIPDLVGYSAGDGAPNAVRVRPGTGGGSFGPSFVYQQAQSWSLTTADADLDGLADVIVSQNSSGRSDMQLLRGEAQNRLVVHDTLASAMGVGTLVPGDFDGDGTRDLGILLPGTDQVGVQLGDGKGGLATVHFTQVQPQDSPQRAVTPDIDADGDTDLAVTLSPSGQTVVYRNTGASVPVQSQVLAEGEADIAAGDVSGDGLPDLALSSSGLHLDPKGVWIALDQGGGLYAAPTQIFAAPATFSVELADVDADGDLDLLAQIGSTSLRVALNQPGGWVQGATADFPFSLLIETRVADMDEDGVTDVLAAFQSGGVHVLSGYGPAGFASDVQSDGASAGDRLELADFDGDGHVDVLAQDGSLAVQALRGDGHGHLQALWRTDPVFAVSSLAVVDLDGDGQQEVLASTLIPGVAKLTHILQTGPAPWTVLPAGKPGAAGVPLLQGSGTLVAGAPVTLLVSHAAPLAPLTLIIGLARIDQPFKGGLLVPSPDILLAGLATDGAGSLPLVANWPTGLPSGLSLYFQGWIADVAASHGLSATTALRAFTP